MDKELYSCRAPSEAAKKETVISTAVFIILCAAMMIAAGHFPYSGVIRLIILLVFAFLIYSVMKRSLFDITYVLYEDRLEFRRRCGTAAAENEVFPKDEAEFFEDKIIFRGKSYPFHPDEKLRELLEI